MFGLMRRTVIRLIMPLSWRLSRRRPADVLTDFAITEEDSGWQFLRAIDKLEDPAHRALMFENLLEEREHSQRFWDMADELRDERPRRAPPSPRNALIDEWPDLHEFLAYAYAGELDISAEFTSYAHASSLPRAATLFHEIQADEDDHHNALWGTLTATTGEKGAHKLIAKARRRRMWKAWLKSSRRMGELFMGLWLTILYFLLGPFVFWAGRKRLRGDGRDA